MNCETRETYGRILKRELSAAMGCTEPIAIAYAAAKARDVLGGMPDRCDVRCSGNIIKNVMGVTVPNSGGMKGVDAAAVLGILGGDAERDLEVLTTVTDEHIAKAKELLANGFCNCSIEENVENLYILITLTAGNDSASVEIKNYHKNITRIEKNGVVIFSGEEDERDAGAAGASDAGAHDDRAALNISDIIDYADSLDDAEVTALLERQLRLNSAIAEEGLRNSYGAEVGRTLLSSVGERRPDTARTVAKAYAAAGSDARMNGCAMPVIINSGSGNQGITVSMPVLVYAEIFSVSRDRLIRALALGNLTAIHQKKYIGSLSAYCGAVSAACGAGAAIAYMLGEKLGRDEIYRQVADTVTNTIATIGGMVCDGAKSSCAAKIASAVDCAVTSYELSRGGHVFLPGEGLVMDCVDDTIASVGRIGREGMHSTDAEILRSMLDYARDSRTRENI